MSDDQTQARPRNHPAQIETSGYVSVVGGSMSVRLDTPAEIRSFRKNPDKFFARKLGATVEQYHAWLDTDGEPRCCGLTVKGRLCGNFVSGGIQLPFDEWLRKDRNEYCAVHGGPGSEEARSHRRQ